MLQSSLHRRTTYGLIAFAIIALFLFVTPRESLQLRSVITSSTLDTARGDHYTNNPSQRDTGRVTNSTLGFSRIFAVGLPERTDKRDALALISALTGIRVEFVDGVKGEDVPDKAVPFGVDRTVLGENNVGSWRAHMNVIRRIVEENLESALIIEDDTDWDVRLKAQLERVAQGTRSLLHAASNPSSPYGDGWDVLWLGHCGEVWPEMLPENKDKLVGDKYIINNDETLPPRERLSGFVDFMSSPQGTRWVHIAGAPICTFAYALSQRGARKVLLDLSIDHMVGGAFDNALAMHCRNSISADGDPTGLYAKCLAVTPPVFFHHRAKGLVNGDSDIQGGGDGSVREKGSTENIQWSARLNVKNLIMGRPMENQFEPGG